MEIKVERITDWKDTLNACRWTVGKGEVDKEPSDKFKESVIRAEHSPIRLQEYDIKVKGIPYWVKVHYIRHHIGIEKFISTQRDDRIEHEIERGKMPQDTLVNMWLRANAQAIINISKVRLCNKASKETREVWKAVVEELRKIDPILAHYCVRNCCYRGFCPEIGCCGYSYTDKFLQQRSDYIKGYNHENI